MKRLRDLLSGVLPLSRPEPAPRAAPPPPPHIMLHPGTHVIDDVTVNVPGELGEMVRVNVSPGRHIVDSKIAYAITGLGGIRIE